MPRNNHCLLILFVILGALPLVACTRGPVEATDKEEPAHVEPIPGTDFNRIVLTERAAQRLDIQTATVQEVEVDGTTVLVVPYGSVLYGLEGETWLYVNPEPLTFHREPITIEQIEGDQVILVDGPAPGTAVVIVGVAELFGTDMGVGK